MAKETKNKRFSDKIAAVSNFDFHSKSTSLFPIILFVLICFFGVNPAGAEKKQTVLVLHSYHMGYPWTDNVTEGLQSAMAGESGVEIYFEYMDTKKYADEAYYDMLMHLYQFKYRERSLDVIVCSDDNALNFLLARRSNLFPDVPIVFCGINNFMDSRIAGHTDITGVVENPDILGTFQIARQLHPESRQVAIVYDQTRSGLANAARIKKFSPNVETKVEMMFLTDMNIDELGKALRALSPQTIVLHLSFARDRDGVFLDLESASKLVNENSAGPVYTCWDVRMKYPGHLGGKVVSGHAQGKTAAQLALRILHGEPVSQIEIIRKSPNIYMFDYAQLKRFGLIEKQLPENSVVINKPFSFYETYKWRIWFASGAFVFLICLVLFLTVNIFWRRRAEEALQEAYRIISRSPVVVFLWKNELGWPVQLVSDNVTRLCGYRAEEFVSGKISYTSIIHPNDLEQVSEEVRRYSSETARAEFTHAPYRIVTMDGTIKWVDDMTFIRRNRAGDITHYQGIVMDVTDRKKAEDEIRQLNQNLELHVRERTLQLEQTNAELEDFVYSVSHDLRAPLRSISGFAEIIDRRYSASLDKEGRHFFDNIIKASRQMGELIDDLLSFSRMGRKSIRPEAVTLEKVLQAARSTLADRIDEKNARVSLPEQAPVVQGDFTLLVHVFINLMENALKYHAPDEVPVIDVGFEADDSYVVMFVSDHGIGIETEYHDKIFKIFQRLHSQAEYPGTGIGLAAVKKAVQMMAGEVWVESEPGQGCVFKVKLKRQ